MFPHVVDDVGGIALVPKVRPSVWADSPEAAAIARIRRVIVVAALCALAYSVFVNASRGYCPGDVTDTAGSSAGVVPECIQLTLGPSRLVYLAIVVIVVVALSRALCSGSHGAALRHADRAAATIAVVTVASIVISQVWFWLIPLTEVGTGYVLYPFPFGAVEITRTPMVLPEG